MGYTPPKVPVKLTNDIAYRLCKDRHKGNYGECNSCKDKFICWTRR